MFSDLIPKSLCMVSKDSVEILKDDEIKKEKVGAKAYGLSAIPSIWTLPFFVISSEMYEMYISCQNIEDIEKSWKTSIFQAMHDMQFDFSQNLFLRSNMCIEDLTVRGQYESYECSISDLFATIKIYFDNIKKRQIQKTMVPVLLQQYSQVLGHGHISNERRLSKEHRDWKGEIGLKNWDGILDNVFTISLRNWRRKVVINENTVSLLCCSSLKNIDQVLETPCAWASNQLLRIHFEWIFDGKHIFIVQADKEQDYGINPMVQEDDTYHSKNNNFVPQVLHKLSTEDEKRYSHYSKILNPLIYYKLGLKVAPIYILENKDEIQNLLNEKTTEQLSNDLDFLTVNPLVIRVDIDTDNQSLKQMLPRTDNIRNKNDAIDWLICKSKKLHEKYNGKIPFIFIFHNFIPAFSSAFAYAAPRTRNVLVESLWGVPEGLYYYTHDKHILDTKQKEFSKIKTSEISVILEKINPKNNFVFPEINGKWKYSPVSTDYIWKKAIPNKSWLKEIAINTRKISEHIGAGVSVMWFVGVRSKTYGCNVFPWYHELYTYDDVPKQTNRKKHSNESNYMINHNIDLEKLQQIVQSGNRENIKYILFKPIEESMIRNKDLIEMVGKIANVLKAVIILEGGVLSHAYYQLKRTGAAVEASNAFDRTVSNTAYDKLVRDKIPEKIKSGGEIVITKKLTYDELLQQLRIKLVEEAFEVLDAENIDELIHELADVSEVIDSIIIKQKINKDIITATKTRKKERAGGFDEGIILKNTALPVYKSDNEDEILSFQKGEQIVSWIDKKEKTNYNEIIKRLKIPIYLKQWRTQLTARGLNKRPDIQVILKGKRVSASLQIEVSINEDFMQLTLFDELQG